VSARREQKRAAELSFVSIDPAPANRRRLDGTVRFHRCRHSLDRSIAITCRGGHVDQHWFAQLLLASTLICAGRPSDAQ
jgi:hypothetical protein